MTAPPLLFAKIDLRERLEGNRQQAHQQLVNWNPDELLATPEPDIVERLMDIAVLEGVTLDRGGAQLLDSTEVTVRSVEFGEVVNRRVTRFTLAVPFAGNPEIFDMRASHRSLNPPRGALAAGELRLFSDGGRDAGQIRADFDGQFDKVEQHLRWASDDMDAHRRAMETEIPTVVAERRAKLLADREVGASIGFPIKPRPDAHAYAVPLRRRQIVPRRRAPGTASAAAPFTPEPTLGEQDYEAALGVLRNMRNALERNPSTTRRLGEEQIRDLLLVSLNAQFEGKAAGEVFNGSGKTDILIRVEDRNVFIGECKIWKGPQTVGDALDQLLGYLVWRDTKAALLLFIRDADVSSVTDKAISKIELHPELQASKPDRGRRSLRLRASRRW